MKRLCLLCSLLPFLSSAYGNESGFFLDRQKSLEEIRQENIKFLNRHASRFSWGDYTALLDELADSSRYHVVTGRNFMKEKATDRVTVYFRHDIDVAPFHAVMMSEEEKKRNIGASYYVLHSAAYYGRKEPGKVFRYTAMDLIYRQIQQNGHEIGVHNDLFSMMLTNGIDPISFQKKELEYYKKAGIKITGTVCHGGVINAWGLNNTWLFSDFRRSGEYKKDGRTYSYGNRSVTDYGFSYEGYLLKCNIRLSDISGYDAVELLKRLRACKPGDRVSLLIHPIHWRRNCPEK